MSDDFLYVTYTTGSKVGASGRKQNPNSGTQLITIGY
jgi:hypothetical protein